MKKIALRTAALGLLLCCPLAGQSASYTDDLQDRGGTLIFPRLRIWAGGALTNVTELSATWQFICFGETSGGPSDPCYGFRDDSGVMMWKDSGGGWAKFFEETDLALTQGAVLFGAADGGMDEAPTLLFWSGSQLCVGCNSPSEELDLLGDLRVKGALSDALMAFEVNDGSRIWNFRAAQTSGSFLIRDATAATNPFVLEAGTPANTLYVDSSGRVGVAGVFAPSSALEVGGNAEIDGLLDRDGSNFFDGAAPAGSFITDIDSTGAFTTASNAATATALAADPAGCLDGRRVSDMAANGTLTCSGFDNFALDASPSSTAAFFGYYDSGISARHEKLTFGALADALEVEIGLAGGSDEQILTRETTGGPLAYEDLCDNISGGVNGTTVTGTTECTVGIDTSADLTIDSLNLDDAVNSIKLDGVSKIDLDNLGGIVVHDDLIASGAAHNLGASGSPWSAFYSSMPASTSTVTVCRNGATSQIVLCDTSSAEFKVNWRELSIRPESLLSLTAREYDYVDSDPQRDYVRVNDRGFGYSAEELLLLGIPGLVSPDGRTVNKSVLIPLLIELLKEQDHRIVALESRIEALEGQ